jgi:hypothetical protein
MIKIKFHWGTNIAIFYILFVVVLVGFVIFSTFNKVDLVDEDYYENEIKYQGTMDKIARSNNLAEPLKIEVSDKLVRLSYPKNFSLSEINGQIHFFRPSDKRLDFKLAVEPDESGFQVVSSKNLTKGLWRVKVDWSVGDTAYYNEQVLMIN